jgi:hypothetical protein
MLTIVVRGDPGTGIATGPPSTRQGESGGQLVRQVRDVAAGFLTWKCLSVLGFPLLNWLCAIIHGLVIVWKSPLDYRCIEDWPHCSAYFIDAIFGPSHVLKYHLLDGWSMCMPLWPLTTRMSKRLVMFSCRHSRSALSQEQVNAMSNASLLSIPSNQRVGCSDGHSGR